MSDSDSWDPDAGADAHYNYDAKKGSGTNVKDEKDASNDDRNQLRSFYEEASTNKMAIPPPPTTSSQNFSQEEALSQHSANLSLAEMSRMEENLLSQTSHHEEEEERQRVKLKKRDRRNKGIKAKKIKRPPTEIQIKNQKEYQRFKYKKKTDIREEKDVGGSMEYLMRKKLGEQVEQRRLLVVARERERKREMEEVTLFDDEGEETKKANENNAGLNDHGANWNFLEEGYVTMPRADADKLPYYVFKNSKRKLNSIREGQSASSKASGDINDESSGSHYKKKRKTGHLMFLEQSTTASSDTSYRRRRKLKNATNPQLKQGNKSERSHQRKCTFSIDEPENISRSFPLHFHQLKTRMDLHAMVDTTTLGSERMVVAHGRNVKRLWTRMVAGGITNNDHDDSSHNMEDDDKGVKAKNDDDDSMSNVSSSSSSSSSSSKSSAHSYQPTGVYSQMSYGTTSVIGMGNVNDRNSASEGTKQNPLFRLMSMVHTLPKITHRHHLLMKVAQELGTNRRLWEEELRYWVEAITDSISKNDVGNHSIFLENQRRVNPTARERWAIKSFLGVDGSVSTPPSWASDPSMPSHPIVLKQRMHSLRSSLVRRFRRWIQREQEKIGVVMPALEDVVETFQDGMNASVKGGEYAGGAKTQEGVEDVTCGKDVKDEASDNEKEEWVAMKMEGVHSEMEDSSNTIKGDPQNAEKGEEGDPDEMMDLGSAAIADESEKLLRSLMDEIQKDTVPGGVDKYAKVIHESNIDTSNIDVALASFIDELTSSKARLRQKQEMDSSHFQHRHALRLAQEHVGYWHESIVSYLTLAETLTQSRDANFYKSGNEFPENASLAQAVMATQSYFANGGGVGCGRKRRDLQPSSWEVKDENHSSDESEVSDADDDELGTTISNPKSSLNNLEKKELCGIQLAAKDIAKRGRDSLANKHLTSFAPIHLTTGIAMIAANLTPHAAELVSRPCHPDASENRTPFDLISTMLSSIEEDGSLISPPRSSWDSKGKIIDEMLVNTMREAAMVFRKCIAKDPDNVDHWSWYVATLLGMLCTAFGTPSSMASSIQKNVKVEDEQTERRQLECFHEIRSNASIALTDFIKFSQSHDCPMFHLAISSMLEWKEAVFLLHRPQSFSGTNNEYGLEVKRLHAYHTYHWAVKVCSKTSMAKVHQLCESKHLPRDALLDILACAIEHNPCERNNWVRLVKTLGAVGLTRKSDTECLHGKHVQSEEGQGSWGKHRVAEWEDQFFRAPKSTAKAVKPESVRMVSAVVDPLCQNVQQMEDKSLEGEAISIHDPQECMGWIWNPVEDNCGMDYDRDAFMNHVLLPANTSNIAFNSQSELLFNSEIQERLSGNPSCEALCMKIVVACHLLGVWHPFVCNSIWWLSVKLWQSTQAPDQLKPDKRNNYDDGLAWLSMHGLDISVYLQCRLKHSMGMTARIKEERSHELQHTFY